MDSCIRTLPGQLKKVHNELHYHVKVEAPSKEKVLGKENMINVVQLWSQTLE